MWGGVSGGLFFLVFLLFLRGVGWIREDGGGKRLKVAGQLQQVQGSPPADGVVRPNTQNERCPPVALLQRLSFTIWER